VLVAVTEPAATPWICRKYELATFPTLTTEDATPA
jgi:hypothetical protein